MAENPKLAFVDAFLTWSAAFRTQFAVSSADRATYVKPILIFDGLASQGIIGIAAALSGRVIACGKRRCAKSLASQRVRG
ncbi:hypothetical protein [Kumtagia ephedrae]|uniref:hypothetical protein n=1 Tax=Kumtagia ephedrae TaxID=2116701 RepID=UPI00105723ED|nr:hypothetical protein [Mesorhizobium ephedrae]